MKILTIIESVNFIWEIIRQNQFHKETAEKCAIFHVRVVSTTVIDICFNANPTVYFGEESEVIKSEPDYCRLISILQTLS